MIWSPHLWLNIKDLKAHMQKQFLKIYNTPLRVTRVHCCNQKWEFKHW